MSVDPNPEQPGRSLVKLAVVVGIVVLAAVTVVGGASYMGRLVGTAIGPDDVRQSPGDVEPGQPVTVEIPFGTSGQEIAAILAAQGVIHSAVEFQAVARDAGVVQSLQAGTYELRTLMDPSEVVAALVAGPVSDGFRVTIVEGLRVEEILASLAESTPHQYADLEAVLLEGEVMTSLREVPDEPTLSDWEGLLFPDTYEFARAATPSSILQRMATTMEQRVNSIDWTSWEEAGHTPYEGIVVASLIETEVRVNEERPIVASVINNRLELGMKLDIDATVLYALGTRDAALFDNTVDSPYNTYQLEGLPPTPIAAPGRASLEAAASPDETPYLFYVLTDLEGRHAFAETLEEHNANVARAREEGILP